VCTLFSVRGTDIRFFRHLFSPNKWQYRDEYIIVIVVLREKIRKKITTKILQKSGMGGIRTCDGQLQCQAGSPLNHWYSWGLLLTNQAYLIITDVLIYCTVVVTMSCDVDGK